MLMIVRWALLRGGRWTPKELMHRFGVNKSTAYRYHEEWRAVFGDQTPRHLKRPPPQADIKAADDAAINALNAAPIDNESVTPAQPSRVSFADLIGDKP